VKNNRFFRRISEAAIASGAPISAQQEILFLLGAGSDTSAVSVGWAMLFLADHPEIQRQLRQSLSQHWTGNEIDASAILKEPSLEAVLQEVMCLYPSVPMVMRKTTSEAVVAGYKLPTSQRIILSFIGLGLANSITNRNEESCLADLIANIQPDDRLMRFGHGPRKCGGRRLALVEISIILACLVQRFEFVRTGSDEVRPVWQLSMTCAGGIPVSLKEC
jgi:cytochrome P450